MKKVTLLAVSALALFACNNSGHKNPEINLTTNIDSVSYSIGANQAKGLLPQIPELNVDAYLKGYMDVADSATLLITDEESKSVLQAFSEVMRQKQVEKQKQELEVQYEGEKQAGIVFLEENKANPEVQVTESGLQYIVLQEGSGNKPSGPTTSVTVHYHGTTPDGTVFDSSLDKDPATFGLNQVIKGWTEGVQLMKEGAKYKFFIPQELAYGANPRPGGAIKPFMPLVFEIELIKVN